MTKFLAVTTLLTAVSLSGCIDNCFIFAEFCGVTGASLVVKTNNPEQAFNSVSAALVEAGYQQHDVNLEQARRMGLAQKSERATTFWIAPQQHENYSYNIRLDYSPDSRMLIESVTQSTSAHNLGALTPHACAALERLLDLSNDLKAKEVFLQISRRKGVFTSCSAELQRRLQALPTTVEAELGFTST